MSITGHHLTSETVNVQDVGTVATKYIFLCINHHGIVVVVSRQTSSHTTYQCHECTIVLFVVLTVTQV